MALVCRRLSVCLFVLVCLAPLTISGAAEPPGTLTGIVRDGSGAIVAGADVVVLTAQQTLVRMDTDRR